MININTGYVRGVSSLAPRRLQSSKLRAKASCLQPTTPQPPRAGVDGDGTLRFSRSSSAPTATTKAGRQRGRMDHPDDGEQRRRGEGLAHEGGRRGEGQLLFWLAKNERGGRELGAHSSRVAPDPARLACRVGGRSRLGRRCSWATNTRARSTVSSGVGCLDSLNNAPR